jgi:hypothetical protein
MGKSTSPVRSSLPDTFTSRKAEASGRITVAPAALAAFSMPERAKHCSGVLTEASVSHTLLAPAASTRRTTSATTSGLVLAACSGRRFQPMLGLMTTRSPRRTKRPMPPSASMARRTLAAGSGPRTMAMSVAPAGLSAR